MTTDAGQDGAPDRDGAVRPDRTAPRPAAARRQPPRHVVRTYACPRCGADADQPCQGRRGDRISHHIQRVELALADRPTRAMRAQERQRRLRAERASRVTQTSRPTPAQSKKLGAQSLSSEATPEGLTVTSTPTDCVELGAAGDR